MCRIATILMGDFAGTLRRCRHSGNRLVLQYAHDYAAILGLTFFRLVASNLFAFAHSARGQHSGEGNFALLKQDVGYILRALLTELLIHGDTADRRSIALYFDHVATNLRSLLRERRELRSVLGIDLGFAV